MRTGSALLHRWSAALEEYDFTVRHRPGNPRLMWMDSAACPSIPRPMKTPSFKFACWRTRRKPEKSPANYMLPPTSSATLCGNSSVTAIPIKQVTASVWRPPKAAHSANWAPITAITRRRRAPFSLRDHGIPSPLTLWDLYLQINATIVFVDCFSKYTILIPSSNHTASTVSEALMRHVMPYFGTPRRLLSDRGREFISSIWTKLLHSLGIQQVLTSPYHPEGNAINERSHRTLNNMLCARLLEGPSTKAWVDRVPGIMLTFNAMPHEPHGFSASMVATGRKPALPQDLVSDTSPSLASEDAPGYVETIQQWLQLTHQQMITPPAAPSSNPYHEGTLIYVFTTPPERTSKLAPRWKGPFRICRIPNEYQVTYEDDGLERTVHINHAKPAKFTAPDLPEPVPPAGAPPPPRISPCWPRLEIY